MSNLTQYIKLLRVKHWFKNIFVFVGIVYSREWVDTDLWLEAIIVAAAFCLVSSATYIFNDIHDRMHDIHHPIKKNRPLASQAISIPFAYGYMAALLIISLLLCISVSVAALEIVLCYFGLNVCYTLVLKKIPIVDVCCIATSFMLRILAGTVGIGIKPSYWLLLCTILLTLFLGFSKRRAELNCFGHKKFMTRQVLQHYDLRYLDVLIFSCASLTVITYALYAWQVRYLILTIPLSIFGIARYLYLLYNRFETDDPILIIFSDPWSIANLGIWLFLTFYLLY